MSNCLIFALVLYWRRWRSARKRGVPSDDYLLIRRSRVPWGLFHVLHGKLDRNTGQVKVVSYKPNKPEKETVEIVFRGHVARGDIPANTSMGADDLAPLNSHIQEE